MILTLRLITGGIGVWLVAIAVAWMVSPADIALQFAITLNGVQGMNTGRGDLGGLFLASGILCFLGVRQRSSSAAYLYAFAILMGAVAFGRVVGFVADGPDFRTIAPFTIEIVFIVVTCMLAGQQRQVPNSEMSPGETG